MTEVIEVKDPRDLDGFIKIPFSLYTEDSFFVHPLVKEMHEKFSPQNPFFIHARARYFIAKRESKPVGRIASIINNRHIEFHREKVGFFGFFESIQDYAVSSSLLDKVSEVLKEEGMERIRGPMNFSTNEESGFLIQGFDEPPLLMTPYNPPYYSALMEKYSMEKVKDLYAYICNIPETLPAKILRVAEVAEKRGFRVRPINMKKFTLEMQIFKDVYNSAWERNWGFIPITEEETTYLAARLRTIVLPELILIAERGDEPVGFMGILPDVNYVLKKMKGKFNPLTVVKALYYSKKVQDLRLMLLGIKADYRNMGVDALLFREGFKGIKKYKRFRRIEFSWILEDNIPVQRLIEMIGARLYKKFRIYEKRL